MPPRTKTNPARNLQLETLLSDKGFTWEFRTGVPIEEFDEEKSLHNQARLSKPIDHSTVERYQAALSNGDVFPGVVAAEPRSAKQGLFIVDGNHRFQAQKAAGRKAVDCYVIVGAQPAAVTMLTFEANTKHGLPTSEQDRLHQALYLIDNNVPSEEAARRLGLKPSTLRAAANIAAVDRRAEDAGIQRARWDKLPNGVKTRLGQISTDEGFAAMSKLTLDAGLKSEDVARAVNDINALRSSSKQVQYVTALRRTFSEQLQTGGVKVDRAGSGRQIRSPRTAFGMALGQLMVIPEPEAIVERMTEDDKPEWIQRTTQAMQRLQVILDALKK